MTLFIFWLSGFVVGGCVAWLWCYDYMGSDLQDRIAELEHENARLRTPREVL